jgi:hypothetical protein
MQKQTCLHARSNSVSSERLRTTVRQAGEWPLGGRGTFVRWEGQVRQAEGGLSSDERKHIRADEGNAELVKQKQL